MKALRIAPFLGALLLASIAPSNRAEAQEGTLLESVPLESAPPPSPPPESAPVVDITPPSPAARAFGDGRGDALAWNDRDPMLEPRPVGLAHFGVQLSATLSSGELGVPFGGELVPYLDLRLTRTLQIRIGAVLGAQLDQGFGDPNLQPSAGLGVWFGGGRVLLGAVGRGIAFRIGGEVGAEYLEHSLGEVSLYAGGLLEVAFRFLEDENLELVFGMAVQDRSHSFRDALRPVLIVQDGAVVRGMVGLGVTF